MFRNYFKTAWRNLRRHPSVSLINILGLSIGLAACLIIFLYVHNELTYDDYQPKANRIARVTTILHSPEADMSFATSPVLLADALKRDFPEIGTAVRLQPVETVIKSGRELFREKAFFYSEPSVFQIFSFSFIEGSAIGALDKPRSIVLTERVAKKYFGGGPVVGKDLHVNGQDYRITGVVNNLPANSDCKIEAMLSTDFSATSSWLADDFPAYTFILFNQVPDLKKFSARLPSFSARYTQPELEQAGAKGYVVRFEPEALADVHFSKGKLVDTPKGNREFNYIFSILAVLILIVALLNYINLSTARAMDRAKEVGIRKVSGALPLQLIRQFLFESFFLIGLAWVAAIGLVELGIPVFNRLLETRLSLVAPGTVSFLLTLFLVTATLAGAYPAFVLSGFRPVSVLKGKISHSGRGIVLRKSLMVVQFVIALLMITGTVGIYSQMRFIEHKDLGFSKTQIVQVSFPDDSVSRVKAEIFCQTLKGQSGVDGVSAGSGMPSGAIAMSSTTAFTGGKKREWMCNYLFIDPQFLPLLHISLLEGRNFSDQIHTDSSEGFLVNEAFVREMGWRSGLGQEVEGFGHKGRVVGVVKNFYYKSLHHVLEPLAMICHGASLTNMLAKIQPAELPRIRGIWNSFFPGKLFEYSFLDDAYDAAYKQDRTTMYLFHAFTMLAIIVSAMGLYGLISLTTVQRIKEIGIRKILGASLYQLISLLARDYVKLIGWASLIALPLAGFGLNRWLSSYAYRISLNGWMFAAPLGLILLIAILVTGYQIIRTALANPVRSLRSE